MRAFCVSTQPGPLSPSECVTQWKEASYKQLEQSAVNSADLFEWQRGTGWFDQHGDRAEV